MNWQHSIPPIRPRLPRMSHNWSGTWAMVSDLRRIEAGEWDVESGDKRPRWRRVVLSQSQSSQVEGGDLAP
jgi:hypothetical protein